MAFSQNTAGGASGSGLTLSVRKSIIATLNNGSKPNVNAPSVGSDLLLDSKTVLSVDNRKNDVLQATKSQKNISLKSKENVRPDENSKNPTVVADGRSHRSLSASSAGSNRIQRCLSKVVWNIQHARDYPLRIRKPDPPKRILPPVPDPNRVGLRPNGSANNEGVNLICRVRPSTTYAQDRLIIRDQAIEVTENDHTKSGDKIQNWSFPMDRAFYGGTQQEIYQEVLHNSVMKAMDGISGLVMLCGRKGSGKTYTCRGEDKSYDYRGLIPRALQEIFREIQARYHEYDIRVSVSYYDLVGETVLDLLAEKTHTGMTECSYRNMTYIKELSYARITNEDEALFTYFLANHNRRQMQRKFSKKPTEAHTLFTFYFEIHSKLLTEEVFEVSKLTVLELACLTNMENVPIVVSAVHDALLETNKSVGHLEKTMSLRLTGDIPIKKIPCRQSKLVYALKDILTNENGKITVVVCISAEDYKLKETIGSLKFASRFKGIYTCPKPNNHPDHEAMLKLRNEQAKVLKMELRMYDLLNTRESPDYVGHSGAQDLFRTAREVKDFVDGRIPAPKFATYKQLENFLGLLKKFAKDGDLPTEPAEILDSIPGRDNLQVTINDADDGKTSPVKDFPDAEGTGELDDKDGVGVGTAPAGAKGKNIKNLMKKKKEEKNLKVEKPSVIITKKPSAIAKKGDKVIPASSLLKDHVSDAGHGADAAARPEAQKQIDDLALTKSSEVITESKAGSSLNGPGVTVALVGGSLPGTVPIMKVLLKAIPKTEAFAVFTTKVPNGMEPFRVVETQRQMTAIKEKTGISLATTINRWIEELGQVQTKLQKLADDRARTRPQTSAGIPVLTFDEYKTTGQIKHLRYLIETGYQDILTCQTDLAGLRDNLTESRKKLLSSFEEWYARTYDETPCEGAPLQLVTGGAPASASEPVGLGITIAPLSLSLSSFNTTVKNDSPTAPDNILAQDVAAPMDATSLGCPAKLAPKDAAELHKLELEQFLDSNPEASVFYCVRDKVRQIVKVREENEEYQRLNLRKPIRKLDPDLAITSLIVDLPSALRR